MRPNAGGRPERRPCLSRNVMRGNRLTHAAAIPQRWVNVATQARRLRSPSRRQGLRTELDLSGWSHATVALSSRIKCMPTAGRAMDPPPTEDSETRAGFRTQHCAPARIGGSQASSTGQPWRYERPSRRQSSAASLPAAHRHPWSLSTVAALESPDTLDGCLAGTQSPPRRNARARHRQRPTPSPPSNRPAPTLAPSPSPASVASAPPPPCRPSRPPAPR